MHAVGLGRLAMNLLLGIGFAVCAGKHYFVIHSTHASVPLGLPPRTYH